ncbi:MAG: hypothetical protein IPK98_03345 [Chloracidobacterium sp.]|nr:hypothetical protein [Chloracidobacterium sp.]
MAANTYDDLVDMLTVQEANIGTYKGDLAATADEQTAISEDLANLLYIRDYAETIDQNKKTVTQIKQAVYNGDESEPFKAFPVTAAGALPFPNALPNALGRHNATNARWKTAPGYTEQIGIAMAIISSKPDSLIPADQKPELDLFGAAANHHFSAVVSKRAESDMWQLWIQRKGGAWELQGTYNGKSVDVSLSLTTPGEPEQILCRVQLRKNNEDYGQPSDPAYVTLNP